MRLIVKTTVPPCPADLPRLTAGEADLLKERWAVGRLEDAREAKAQTLLRRIHCSGLWLGCDCRGTTYPDPPVLHVRSTVTGLCLVRSSQRTAHHQRCCFAWNEGELGTIGVAAHKRQAPSSRTQASFVLNTGCTQPSTTMMLAALDELIAGADLERVAAQARSPSTDLAAARTYAQQRPIAPPIVLGDILFTHPDWVFRHWAEHRLAKLREAWPGANPCGGWLMLAGSRFDEGSHRLYVDEHLYLQLPDDNTHDLSLAVRGQAWGCFAYARHAPDAPFGLQIAGALIWRRSGFVLRPALPSDLSALLHTVASALVIGLAACPTGADLYGAMPWWPADGFDIGRPHATISVDAHDLSVHLVPDDQIGLLNARYPPGAGGLFLPRSAMASPVIAGENLWREVRSRLTP